MFPLAPYLALAAFPVVSEILPNPIAIWFLARHGRATLQIPEEAIKQRVGGWNILVAGKTVLVGVVFLIAWRSSASLKDIGLTLPHLPADVAIGCVAGGLLVAWKVFLAHSSRSAKRARIGVGNELQGPLVSWILAFSFSVFAEELWRAFCLYTFRANGYSVAAAVALTALAFGLGHMQYRLGGAAAMATVGAGLALLFEWRWSLIVPYTAHLISNLDSLVATRRAHLQSPARRASE